jgi:hypothetical protein
MCGSAVLHALSRHSGAVPDRGKIDEGELHKKPEFGSTH